VAGFLLQKELDYLDGAVAQPKRPFVAIVGGSKVSSKIGVIESLINKVDKIILGCAVPTTETPLCLCHLCRRLTNISSAFSQEHTLGSCSGGMIFTFYKARGLPVGSSLVEEDKLDLAKELEAKAKEKGVEFILPTDVIIADKFDAEANTQTVAADAIPDGWMVRPIWPAATALVGSEPPVLSSDLSPFQQISGDPMQSSSLG